MEDICTCTECKCNSAYCICCCCCCTGECMLYDLDDEKDVEDE